jgi:hypothetical protein
MAWKFGRPGTASDLSASANATLALLLGAITSALILLDAVWGYAGHFNIDVRSYAIIAALLLPTVCGAIFYSRFRPDPLISATCAGAAFLLAFSPSCAVLSYLLSTVAGPRIDGLLAQIDHAMGFDWVALMNLAADHVTINALLKLSYVSVMPQIMLLSFILGWSGRTANLYGLCLAIAAGALICVLVWAAYPSFGAFSIFDLPPATAAKLGLALDGNYGRDLVALLKNGPGLITPLELRGVVGFPSFHTVQALVLIWYARKLPFLRWIALALNIAVVIATPIHGGHHLIDVFGGIFVALAAIAAADWIVNAVRRSHYEKRFYKPAGAIGEVPALQ